MARDRDTWDEVERPTLEWLADNTGIKVLKPSKVAEAIGADTDTVRVAVSRLGDAGFIYGKVLFGGETGSVMTPKLTERGLRAAGVWPSEDPYADLIRQLDAAIARSSLPDDRSKLEKVRDSLLAAGRDVTVDVLASVAQRQMGLG